MSNYEDRYLSPEQLDDKYNLDGNGEHPEYTRWDWIQVVAQRSTVLGYWEWVAAEIEDNQDE